MLNLYKFHDKPNVLLQLKVPESLSDVSAVIKNELEYLKYRLNDIDDNWKNLSWTEGHDADYPFVLDISFGGINYGFIGIEYTNDEMYVTTKVNGRLIDSIKAYAEPGEITDEIQDLVKDLLYDIE
jgi:hypothetical protein